MRLLLLQQRTSIASFSNMISNLKKRGKANITVPMLRKRSEALEHEWDAVKNRHGNLLSLMTDALAESVPYFANDEFATAQEKYEDALDFVVNEISKRSPVSGNLSEGNRSSVNDSFAGMPIKLPEQTIPRYSGDPTEWEHFADLFSAAVIRNRTLSDSQRLQYLNSCLDGEALAAISGFSITDRNFEPAWQELRARFYNKNVIISTLLAPMRSLKPIHQGDLESIQQVTVKVKQSLAALRTLGYEISAGIPLLEYFIIQKLDSNLKEIWERSRKDPKEFPKWDELYAFLSDLTTPLLLDKAMGKKIEKVGKANEPNKRTSITNYRSHNATVEQPTTNKQLCTLCKESHKLWTCSQYKRLSAKEKYLVVKTSQYCTVCLSAEHTISSCESGVTCDKCGGLHHGSLHFGTPFKSESHQSTKGRRNKTNRGGKEGFPKKTSTAEDGQTEPGDLSFP